jgi:hypothetical protein
MQWLPAPTHNYPFRMVIYYIHPAHHNQSQIFLSILICNVHFQLRTTSKIYYFISVRWFKNFCNILMYMSFAVHIPEHDHMSG